MKLFIALSVLFSAIIVSRKPKEPTEPNHQTKKSSNARQFDSH
jgi:hypothetical protein